MLPGADSHDVRVVVLTGQRRGRLAPHQGGTHPTDLVRGDLLAVARPADHHPQGPGVGHDRLTSGGAEGGVVVGGVVGVGAVVDDVVAASTQVLGEGSLEVEPRVVGGKVDTHGPMVPDRSHQRRKTYGIGPNAQKVADSP